MGGLMLMQFEDFVSWANGILPWIYNVLVWWFNAAWWWVNLVWDFVVILWASIFGSTAALAFWFKAVLFPGLVFILMAIIFVVWATRKTWGRIQGRRGPYNVGKYGGLQLFADAIKLIGKESIIPDGAKKWMYRFLPSFLLLIVLLPFVFIPWDPDWVIVDLSVSLVLIFAFLTAIPVISLFAGWISGSKYTVIGGFRAANNQFAAEIPLVLSSVGPALLAGSLSVLDISIVQANSFWFIILLPLNMVTFLVSAVVSVGMVPFDAPVADSEILFGWRTEFSGIWFVMTYFAEFAEMMFYSAMVVTLFLGGFSGPAFIPGVVTFIIKLMIVMFFFIILTSSFYRLRQDQIVKFSWKYLLPLTVFNILLVMFGMAYFGFYIGG